MKKHVALSIIAFVLLWSSPVFGQQEAHNTQFMYNKLAYNPGFAGSKEVPCLTAIYRNQWMGLEGAPQLQILSFSLPVMNQRVGLGVNLQRQTIGITEKITANGIYAYRIRMGRGYLGIGVQGSFQSLKNNYQDSRLVGTQDLTLDQSIPATQQQKFIFNAGAGAYYEGEFFYIGFSIPRLLENNIDFADNDDILSREIRHFYLMGGASFGLGDAVRLQPQLLMRYVDNAPLDADVNLSLLIASRFVTGVTYRLGGSSVSGVGESIDILLAGQLTNNFLLGLSYDITLSDLKDYNTGSIEVLLRYCFGSSEGREYINPRFF